ncbi:MAG TPA: DUF4446 family protein [Chloroflexota bacterium]
MNSLYSQHAFIFWLALLAVSFLLAVWLGIVNARSRRTAQTLNDLFEGASSESIGRMLVEYLGTVRSTAADVQRMRHQHEAITAVMPSVIRHVGLVRFSPFHDTGGDQSFALAILDSRADGVVVTALHSRTDSRLYAKPVEGGRSTYSLSPEESEAIERALRATEPQAVAQ